MISLSTCTTVPSMWSRHTAVSFLRTYKGCRHAPRWFIIDQHVLYSFFLILEFFLVNILPMDQPLLPNTGYTWGTKTKDTFPSVTIQFRGLVSLTWMAHINTSSYISGTGTTITLPFSLWFNIHYSGIVCGEKWLDETVPGKKFLEIHERKRNFMNIIPSTCFKQFFCRCCLLTVKPKVRVSLSISRE